MDSPADFSAFDPATLARAVRTSSPLLLRFLGGFDESNRTTQAPGLPNHAAWTLGHLALTLHRAAERLDGSGLPERDFIAGAAAGDAERFGSESVAFGSRPVDEPGRYPSLERSRAIFEGAVDRLANGIGTSSRERLAQSEPWGRAETTMGDLIVRMIVHNGTHAGQLADLRRALGMPPVIG
ncbi:MAG: DinB family protein [Phycisphaerales bacterium JB037]